MLLLAATVYGVLRGEDMGELRAALLRCRTGWIARAAGCVILFILLDAASLWLLLDSFGMGVGHRTCFLTACVGFFFSAITPSASGGQPMQVYYLRSKGIPVSVSSVAFLVMAMCYKLILVLIGLGLALFSRGFLRVHLGSMMFLFWVGLLLTGGWMVFLGLMVFRPGLARGMLIWGMSVLEELRIMKNRELRQAALEVSMEMYEDAAEHLKKHPALLLEVLGVMLLRRGVMFSVTWCVYRALGLSGVSWIEIALLQAVISVCADMLPLPGAMGISEGLFLKAYASVFGALALPGMVLSRGIGHYSQLLFCGVFSVLALAFLNRNRPTRD